MASVLFLFLCALIHVEAMAGDETVSDGVRVDVMSSAWRPIPDATDDPSQGSDLQTSASDPIEPILVPLPLPAIAAGTGLGIAWLLRKRLIRS